MPEVSSGLFRPEGDTFVPTDFARGPWSPETLHGGSIASLLAGAIEGRVQGGEQQVTRMTVELMRPVPVVPLRVTTALVRPGRKVQLVEASLWHGDTELAQARAVLLRTIDAPVPDGARASRPSVPGPELGVETATPRGGYQALHNAGAEIRFVRGVFGEPGPATCWIRLRHAVVAGEPVSPLQRVAAAADFGNGVSSVLDFGKWVFINPDLTIYLNRLPIGEWVCVQARTEVEDRGVGLASSRLLDESGPIGHSAQSLLIDPL
jgi:hypothetical protein